MSLSLHIDLISKYSTCATTNYSQFGAVLDRILRPDVVFPGLFEFSGIRKFSRNSDNSREISGISIYQHFTSFSCNLAMKIKLKSILMASFLQDFKVSSIID